MRELRVKATAAARKSAPSRHNAAGSRKTIPTSIVIRNSGRKTTSAAPKGEARRAARRGRAKSDAKRRAILRGAKAVFLSAGFEGANMDAVATRAGVSKMTVYRHFGSKEDLFAGVITELGNMIVAEDLERIFAERPEEALRRFARKMIDIVFDPDTIELHRIVIAECRRFPKLGRFFYASGPQVCIDVLARYLKRNSANPRFRVVEPVRTAEEFLELLRGYGHLRVLLRLDKALTPLEIERRIEGAVRHVLQAAG
jgi:TetR/AcrR family transcriptional regulator, mexJK operon transcriptional repressor